MLKQNTLSKEEWANVYSHGVAVPFCLLGSFLLLSQCNLQVTNAVYYGAFTFCFSLTAAYLISTLYHYQSDPRKKHIFRIMDHIAIYYLIVGTHTPFLLLYLPTTYGMSILATLWICVFFGTIFKIFFVGRFEKFSIALYLVMGWSGVLTLPYIWEELSVGALLGICIGGLFYTTGAYFYTRNDMRYNHAIWHLFVIAGSTGHFWALWLCLH
ncbi:MAG: hemolysin III [Polaribacter sp.]|jgi:hemolysin III